MKILLPCLWKIKSFFNIVSHSSAVALKLAKVVAFFSHQLQSSLRVGNTGETGDPSEVFSVLQNLPKPDHADFS
jgi:hypothetical protein